MALSKVSLQSVNFNGSTLYVSDGKIQQSANSNVQTYHINYWFTSGTTNVATFNYSDQSSVAVAKIEWSTLYAYAGTNHGIGLTLASTRRINSNTSWTALASNVLNTGDTGNAPSISWNNGVLQMTVGGSVQVTALITITCHGGTITVNV